LLDIIAKNVYKLLLLARVIKCLHIEIDSLLKLLSSKQENQSSIGTRATLVQIMKHCLEKLRALSESVDSLVVFAHIKVRTETFLRQTNFLIIF
jgi:hypothetical protein